MQENPSSITRLLNIMADLRHPVTGCPWDRDQNFSTIAPYTIEEAYEVAEAIRTDDREALRGELGDLLFQIVFYAQMSSEEGGFGFDDVVQTISDKMIRRHPHVFSEGESVKAGSAQMHQWETIKAEERRKKSGLEATSILDDVPLSFPALLRANKLQGRTARVGFDWSDAEPILAKIAEELEELHEATESANRNEQKAEVGDLLFACVNLSRHYGIDAEDALRMANTKFETRFRRIEELLAEQGKTLEEATLAEMDVLWDRVKLGENNPPSGSPDKKQEEESK
tara:strand:+ start:1049 stop:1900 length:852 start_codon:yes stop_codon:yes gene_type:complete